MEPLLWDWIGLIVRWLHVIAGIAWIGSSFYFIHLDASLRKRERLPHGVAGEAWQVHGGGFYRMQKYMVAPPELPDELTWFKWEAYTTWLSGAALMVVVYYLGAEVFLIDRDVLDLPVWGAIAISIGSLALGWLVPPSVPVEDIAEFTVSTSEARSLDVAIETDRPLEGATISILLAGDVQLDGYGARRELKWTTDLDAGINRLRLPVRANSESGGRMFVRLEHPDSRQSFVVRLTTGA